MTLLVLTDKTDILDVVNHPDKYTHKGDGLFVSSIGTQFQVPLSYVSVPEAVVEEPKKEAAPVHKTPIVRERRIVDGETLVFVNGGYMEESEWLAMTHTVRDRDKPPVYRHEQVTTIATRYHAGESKSGKPVIKMGNRTVEWGFKTQRDRDNRLTMLIETERELA